MESMGGWMVGRMDEMRMADADKVREKHNGDY